MKTSAFPTREKQLLEAKSQSAALQTENEQLRQRVVDLEAALISLTEDNKALTQARVTFQQTLCLEKEALQAEADQRLAKTTAQVRLMELHEEGLKAVNDQAQKTIDALRLQLADYQAKFTEMLSDQPHLEGLDIQGIFNHEYREKERLNEIIMEQARQLNSLQTTADALKQENQRFREQFGVPQGFGHIALRNDGTNHLTRIEYLEREVEGLEEERAELRCKLRQLAAMVNPREWDGDVFANLNLEQKELVCLYAINLLNGKNEVYLSDKSRELARENDALKIEVELLRRNADGQQQTLHELTKALKGELFRMTHGHGEATDNGTDELQEDCKAGSRKGKLDDPPEAERKKEEKILRDLAQSWYAAHPKSSVSWKGTEGRLKTGSADFNMFWERLIAELAPFKGPVAPSDACNDTEGTAASRENQPDEILAQLRLLKATLGEKTRLAEFNETQAIHLHDLVSKGALAHSCHYSLLKENAVVHQANIKLGFENEALKSKLDFELDRRISLGKTIDQLQEAVTARNLESQTQLAAAVKTISHLNTQLSDSVPLSDFKDSQTELAAVRLANVELTTSLATLSSLKPRYAELISEHAVLAEQMRGLQLQEFHLACEVRLLEDLLGHADPQFLLFRQLVLRIADKLKMEALAHEKGVLDRFNRPSLPVLSLSQLNQLFESTGILLGQAEWDLLTSFLLTDSSGCLLTFDLTRKLRLVGREFVSGDANVHLRSLFQRLIQKTGLGVEDLFGLFDSDGDGFLTSEQIMTGLRVLGLVDSASFRQKLFIDALFFGISKRLSKGNFIAIFRNVLATRNLDDRESGDESSPELGMAALLNQFLAEHTPLNSSYRMLFDKIDAEKKGNFTFKDLEMFFEVTLRVKVDKFSLERLFSCLEKQGLSQVVTPVNFEAFLRKASVLATIQSKEKEVRRSGRLGCTTKPQGMMRMSESRAECLTDSRQALTEGEKRVNEFALNQQRLLVNQLSEQLNMLEKEVLDKETTLRLYKEEVTLLTDIAHKTTGVSATKTQNISFAPFSDSQGHINSDNEAKIAHELASKRMQKIQSLRLQLTLAEQEKLDTFKAAAGIAAQHGLSLKDFVVSLEGRSREMLMLNALREKEDEIQHATHKADTLQARLIEEKLECQRLVEGLCEKLGMLQAETTKTEANRLLVLQISQLEQLAAQNHALHARLTDSEVQKAALIRKVHQSETELESLKVDFRYFLKRVDVSRADEGFVENGLVQRFQELLDEAKMAQMGRIRAEKELQMERSEREVSGLKADQTAAMVRTLEAEVEKLAVQKQQREVFWSLNYQKLLSTNAKVSSDLEAFAKKRRNDEIQVASQIPTHASSAAGGAKTDLLFLNQMAGLPLSQMHATDQEPNETHSGVTTQQLRQLLERVTEPIHSKELLQGAQSTLTLLENMLVEKQEEIKMLNRQIDGLKNENGRLRDELADQTLQPKENLENRSLRAAFPLKNDSKVSQELKASLIRPLERQRNLEKQLRMQVEELRRGEERLKEEVTRIKNLNGELMIKVRENEAVQTDLASKQAERIRMEAKMQDLEKKVQQMESNFKKKEREAMGLLETIRDLKNEMLGRIGSQTGPHKRNSSESEAQRTETEAKLHLTLKKLKEVTSRLKETSEELAVCKEALSKATLVPTGATIDMIKTKKSN